MSSEKRIESVFPETRKHFGYDEVSVEISDFKVRWKRSYGWIAFRFSDYIEDAPDAVIRDLANALFTKIAGKECGYGDEMIVYVKDTEFTENCRPRCLKRSKKLVLREAQHKDLLEITGDWSTKDCWKIWMMTSTFCVFIPWNHSNGLKE